MFPSSDTHKNGLSEGMPGLETASEVTRRGRMFDEFLLQIHRYSDLRSTCYSIASELRRVAGCDRVTVLAKRRGRFRVIAISNLDHFDVRSAIVLAAEQLAATVDTDSGPHWIDEEPAGNSDELLLVRDFIEQSHSRGIGILPLCAQAKSDDHTAVDEQCAGMIICERFTARIFEPDERRYVSELSQHAAVAVGRAIAIDRVPFFRFFRTLSTLGFFSSRRSRIKYVLATVAVVAIVSCFACWPVAFTIPASATLQPVNRRDVFAPVDGIVQQLRVKEGDRVAAGDVLVDLRNDELEMEYMRLVGELETNRRRLQTLQSARLEAVKPGAPKGEPQGRLAADEEQLKEMIRGLESQQTLRQKQREQLVIRSPIAGQLLTWDIERRLRARPVRRGQRLLTVADVNDRWTLEMQIADADVGHVLKAKQEQASPLTITFRTPARPDVDQIGSLEEVADWTQVDEAGKSSVKMTAVIPHPDSVDARPGSVTTASIQLGKRARAYVWFRPVIDYLRMQLWL